MDARRAAFVERMGLLAEDEGMTRIGGRIFGYLLLTPGESSLDDIATALEVSRASVSTDARRLAQMGLIERSSRPGDRRDYYSAGPTSMRSWLDSRMRGLQRFIEILGQGEDLAKSHDEVRDRLERWRSFHEEALASFTQLLARLDSRSSQAAGGPTPRSKRK